MEALIFIYLLLGAIYMAYGYSKIDYNEGLEEMADEVGCSLELVILLMVTIVPIIGILLWPLLFSRRMVKWFKTS